MSRININYDFCLYNVICDDDVGRALIEEVLNAKINHIDVKTSTYYYSGINFDIVVEGQAGVSRVDVYYENTSNKAYVTKRFKEYIGLRGDKALNNEESIEYIKHYVILISTCDLYGKGQPVYKNTNKCSCNDMINIDDCGDNIILNTEYTDVNKNMASSQVIQFLDYIKSCIYPDNPFSLIEKMNRRFERLLCNQRFLRNCNNCIEHDEYVLRQSIIEGKKEMKIAQKLKQIGKLSYEEISEITHLDVTDIAQL